MNLMVIGSSECLRVYFLVDNDLLKEFWNNLTTRLGRGKNNFGVVGRLRLITKSLIHQITEFSDSSS